MAVSDHIGMGLWVATKAKQLGEAWDLYQATKSKDAALAVATKLSEISAGIAVGYLVTGFVEAIQKTGLDRLFDSIRKDKSYGDYVKTQENWENFADYSSGEAAKAFICWPRDYASGTGMNFIPEIKTVKRRLM